MTSFFKFLKIMTLIEGRWTDSNIPSHYFWTHFPPFSLVFSAVSPSSLVYFVVSPSALNRSFPHLIGTISSVLDCEQSVFFLRSFAQAKNVRNSSFSRHRNELKETARCLQFPLIWSNHDSEVQRFSAVKDYKLIRGLRACYKNAGEVWLNICIYLSSIIWQKQEQTFHTLPPETGSG